MSKLFPVYQLTEAMKIKANENNQLLLCESIDLIKPTQMKIDIWFFGEGENDREMIKGI